MTEVSTAAPRSADPRVILNDSPMSRPQVLIVVVTMLLAAIEGYSVLSITLAAPQLIAQWHITKATLGSIIGAGYFGMGTGSLLLGTLADMMGRRPLILSCIGGIVLALLLSAFTITPLELGILRFLLGVCVGGCTSPLFAVVAEFSNTRSRSLAIAVMTVGTPIGGALGSLASAPLLAAFGWQSIFLLAAALAAVAFVLYAAFVPETFSVLIRKRSARTLQKINRLLARLGHPSLTALPQIEAAAEQKLGLAHLFSRAELTRTITLTLAFCLNTITVFFLLSWLPQLVVDLGLSASRASIVSSYNSIGGVLGSLTAGWLARRLTLGVVVRSILVGNCAAVGLLGAIPATLPIVDGYAFISGFFAYGSMTAIYAYLTLSFPSRARSSGVGLAQAAGRATSVGSAVLAGVLLTEGLNRGWVALIMATGSMMAALIMQIDTTRHPGSSTDLKAI
jgi:MFS family permease